MKQKLLLKTMLLLFALIAGSSSVWAADVTDVINNSATSSNLGNTGTSSWASEFDITGSSSGVTYHIKSMGTTGTTNALQWNANGFLYMKTTRDGYQLKSVTVTTTANKNIGVYAQNTAYSAAPSGSALATLAATSGGATYTFTSSYKYLALKGTASSTSITNITIVWQEASGPVTYTVTYDANGGTGTMTDASSPYTENANVTLLSNTFTAPEGYIFSSWSVKDAGNNDVTVTDGKFTMPASNVTVKAQWVIDPSAPFAWVETSLASLTSSDVFVIAGTSSAGSFSLENNGMSAPIAKAVTISEGKITSTVSDANRWNVTGNATDGYTFYPNGDDEKWLYCNTDAASGSNENMRVGTGNRKVFELEGSYLKTKDDKTTRYLSVNGSQDWRGYINTTTAPTTIKFYKKADANQPSITADDINIAWNANGSIEYDITNPVGGGNLTASTTADWITIGTIDADNVSFTATANPTPVARTATVTLTYTYNTNQTVTKDVTITQAAGPYSTISDLFNAATTTAKTVLVTFDNWVVSGISTNGKNVFVTDGTNGFVIYSSTDQSSTYAVGNILSGTGISCSLKKNYGYAQITDLASTPTINTGGTISEANIDMDALAGVNTGALVSYDNLTCSVDGTKYYLSDGTTQLQVYSTLFVFGSLKAGMKYNITGIYQQYNSTKEILPRSAADIVEVAAVITPAKTYTTLTAASALDFTGLADLEAYIVKDNDTSDGYVTLTKVNKVPANTGLVLKASSTGSPIDVPVLTGDANDVTGNLMVGSATATTAVAANAGYILSNGVFQPSSGGDLPAGKAYLNVAVTSSAPVLNLNFGDDTTGVSGVRSKIEEGRGEFYNLNGQCVAQPTKGLYIVNGKKVVIK